MNKSFIFGTITGAAAGALATYLALKEYYYAKSEKEINEVRDHYISEIEELKAGNEEIIKDAANVVREVNEMPITEEDDQPDDEPDEYERVVEKYNYSNISEETKPKKVDPRKPHCITPEQYNQEPGYAKISLDYFAGNGIFTNIEGMIEDEAGIWVDIRNTISRFGDYEDELLYVRNEQTGCDYEVMWHEDSYESDEVE